MADFASLKELASKNGQEHLLKFWDGLSAEERTALDRELRSLELEEINQSFKEAMLTLESAAEKIDDHIQPLPPSVCGSITRTEPARLEEFNNKGEDCLLCPCICWFAWYSHTWGCVPLILCPMLSGSSGPSLVATSDMKNTLSVLEQLDTLGNIAV